MFESDRRDQLLEIADDGEFVARAYSAVLQRNPDPDGLEHWLGELRAGRIGRPALIELLVRSDEAKSLRVESEPARKERPAAAKHRALRKSSVVPFQWPRQVSSVAECEFYHTIDLPTLGTQVGHWDLRSGVEDYLGHQTFTGKRVIDVGTASGFLCFEMEKRGAQVIAFDSDGGLVDRHHDVIPYHDFEERFQLEYNDLFRELLAGLDRLKNSYWLSHRLLGSKARVLYGNIYDPPGIETLGDIDYVFFGNILLHLQNPLRAIAGFASQAREKCIITETAVSEADDDNPAAYLAIDDALKDNFHTWWRFTPGFFRRFLTALGYKRFTVRFHDQNWVLNRQKVRHFTIVAER